MSERMQRIEGRLGGLEMLMGVGTESAASDSGRDVKAEGAAVTAAIGGVAEEGVQHPALDDEETQAPCGEVLRKAREGRKVVGVMGEAVEEDVRPGQPQSLRGQQARHGAARLWEGVL